MGYVGPVVVRELRSAFPDAILAGYDMAYFAACLTGTNSLPENELNEQYFGDVRTMPENVLNGIDVVIHLAAISNDPMGNKFENVTLEVNCRASIKIAEMAKKAGVKSFIFASSCSIYGAGGSDAKKESSELNPLTAYARSKAITENALQILAGPDFTVTCLRFATACGMSKRLRLDLVLNDFVASAVAAGEIDILSDGTPWRPLIHVKDMARAISWAAVRSQTNGGSFLAINTGADEWNYQVKDLAEAVASVIPGTVIKINQEAPPDKRSYRVDFSMFKQLAPDHQPLYTLKQAIRELYVALVMIGFQDRHFRDSELIRLKTLTELGKNNLINDQLEWISKAPEIESLRKGFKKTLIVV